jgi:hypothetical protein
MTGRLFDGYVRLSLALGGFLALSFVACNVWDAAFPSLAMRSAWQPLLAGFAWWSWGSFLLGLAETLAYGFWLGLLLPVVRWAGHGVPRTAAGR